MYYDNCKHCGCELGFGSLNKTTNQIFNQSMCMRWHDDPLSITLVDNYYKEFGTLDGCYEYMIITYADQIDRATDRFHQYAKNATNLTREAHRNIVVHHFACETIEGYQIELDIAEELKTINPNITIKHSNPEVDLKYGIDFFVIMNKKVICGVQCKGISWYYWIKKGGYQAIQVAKSTDQKWKMFKERYNRPKLKIVTMMMEGKDLIVLDNNEKLQKINIKR